MSRQIDDLVKAAVVLYLVARVVEIEPRVLLLLSAPQQASVPKKPGRFRSMVDRLAQVFR